VLVGIVSGLSAIVFYVLLDFFKWLFLEVLAGYKTPSAPGEVSLMDIFGFEFLGFGWSWIIALVPAIGGLISGFLVYRFAPEAEGHGTDAVIHAVHSLEGFMRGRVAVVKTFASAVTIGSGGSAGREGPIAQISSSVTSVLARKFNLTEKEREIMVLVAAAAGIGSIFKSPIGGALFGVEVPYKKDYEADVFVPALIASFIGYTIFCLFAGWQPIFRTPPYTFSPYELPLFALLGLICGILARLYVETFYAVRNIFRRMRIKNYYKPAIGGLLVGLLGLIFPQVLSSGYGWVQIAIYGKLAIELMIILIFMKILATSLTIGSGGSGGVFAPSVVIGAMIGGSIGLIFSQLFPNIVCDAGVFVIIGMASFFAGAAKVPLTAIIIIAEMTGDYNLLPAAILASMISYVVSGERSIYESQLEYREESPIHLPEIIDSALERILVKEIASPDFIAIKHGENLKNVYRILTEKGAVVAPVVDEEGSYKGIISVYDILRVPEDKWGSLKVSEIVDAEQFEQFFVTLDDSLKKAISLMLEKRIPRVPVVKIDEEGKKKVIGCIKHEDIIKALYYKTK